MSTELKKEENEASIVENDDGSAVFDDGTINETTQGAVDEGDTAQTDATGAGEDARHRTGGEDDGGEQAELDAAASDADREAIRARRRQERKDRKDRRVAREDNYKLELAARDQLIDDMRTRLQAIERRNSGSELAQIDGRIKHEERNIQYLREVIADGTKVANGEAVAEATVQLTHTMRNLDELGRIKKQMAKAQSTPEAPQLDPRMVGNAANWIESNKWYNPAGADADSRQVLVIDQRLAEEGFNPVHPGYWQELDRRVRAALPHRDPDNSGGRQGNGGGGNSGYNADASQRRQSRNVVTGSGQGGSSGGAGNGAGRTPSGYTVSPERVAALKDAGMWDDPKARADAIRRFREYDAQNSEAQSSSSR